MRVVCNNCFECLQRTSVCYHRVIHTHNSAGDKSTCSLYCSKLNIAVKCIPVENVRRKQKLINLNKINE